jgi:hypothetical protein
MGCIQEKLQTVAIRLEEGDNFAGDDTSFFTILVFHPSTWSSMASACHIACVTWVPAIHSLCLLNQVTQEPGHSG